MLDEQEMNARVKARDALAAALAPEYHAELQFGNVCVKKGDKVIGWFRPLRVDEVEDPFPPISLPPGIKPLKPITAK